MTLSRRHFLGALAVTSGVALTTGPAALAAYARQRHFVGTAGTEIRSVNGVLRAQLNATQGTAMVNGVGTGGMATFNAQFPGPTLIVKPGDRMLIRLINNTDLVTNLHFHGMHVSPKGRQDNVFIEVKPGGTQAYDVRIPKDHPSGLFWYHPHWHPNAGPAVWAGLAGLLIVEGGAAEAPGIRDLTHRTLGIREGGLGPDGTWADYTTLTPETDEFYVNGELLPTVRMRPGETQFWQVGNIGVSAYFRLSVPDHEFTVVEEDGAMVWRTWQTESVLMPPGKRYGVLVTAPRQPGTVNLTTLGYDQGNDQWPERDLARIVVAGEPMPSFTAPATLQDAPTWIDDPIANRRVLTLSQNVVEGQPLFYINDTLFDEFTLQDIPQVRLNTTEEWVIRNASSLQGGAPHNEDHPFHIHVNDFVVVERGDWDPVTNATSNARQIIPRSTADTVNVPWNEYVRFRTHFSDFTGRSVYHCHLLYHEDHGMMGAFDILDEDGNGPGPGQQLPSHSH